MSDVSVRVVRSFVGVDQTLAVRLKGTRYRMYVTMGEIRVPVTVINKDVDLDEIGKKYGCKIKLAGQYAQIVPNVVGEIIREDGFLANCDREHQAKLKEWLVKNLRNLLIELTKLSFPSSSN